MFSCLFFSVFDKFNFSSMRAAIGEKYLQTLRGRSNFWPSLFVWFFFLPEMIHSLYSIFTRSAPKWRTHGRTQKLMGELGGSDLSFKLYIYIFISSRLCHMKLNNASYLENHNKTTPWRQTNDLLLVVAWLHQSFQVTVGNKCNEMSFT